MTSDPPARRDWTARAWRKRVRRSAWLRKVVGPRKQPRRLRGMKIDLRPKAAFERLKIDVRKFVRVKSRTLCASPLDAATFTFASMIVVVSALAALVVVAGSSAFEWTTLTPVTGSGDPTDDTRYVCVSQADGDNAAAIAAYGDGNRDIAYAMAHPFATWWDAPGDPHGASYYLRPGKPDWLCIKRGETFTFSNDAEPGYPGTHQRITRRITASGGASADATAVITCYGDGGINDVSLDRPLIVNTNLLVERKDPYGSATPTADHVRVVGLQFQREDEYEPSVAISITGEGTGATGQDDVLVEDCAVDGYVHGIEIESPQGVGVLAQTNMSIRGCTFSNCYDTRSNLAQGMFLGNIDGLLVDHCTVYRNGAHADTIASATNLSISATTKLITRATGSFIDDGYQTAADNNNLVQLFGFSNGANNARFSVGTVTDTTLELIGDGTDHRGNIDNLVTESADSAHGICMPWLGSIYAHNVYINDSCSNVVFRGCTVAIGDGIGMRCGGLLEDNLVLASKSNGVSCLNPTTVRRCVFIDGSNIDSPAPGDSSDGSGNLSIAFFSLRDGDPITQYPVDIYSCIWMNNTTSRVPLGVNFGPSRYDPSGLGVPPYALDYGDVQDFSLHDCVFYNAGRAISPNGLVLSMCGTGNSIARNRVVTKSYTPNIANPDDAKRYSTLVYSDNDLPAGLVFEDDQYWSDVSYSMIVPDLNYIDITGGSGQAEWESQSGETGAVYADPTFPDATRTMKTYMESIGYSPADEAEANDMFLAQAALQSKDNWREEFTAAAANAYFQAGFGVTV